MGYKISENKRKHTQGIALCICSQSRHYYPITYAQYTNYKQKTLDYTTKIQ